MTTDLLRFGVAMERNLLEHLGRLVADRGVTRSEVLRDLVRAEVETRGVTHGGVEIVTQPAVRPGRKRGQAGAEV